MKVVGTKFQLRVWNETKKIHRGRTESYKCIANKHQVYRTEVNAFAKYALSIIIRFQTKVQQNGETEGHYKIQNSNKKNFFLIKELT